MNKTFGLIWENLSITPLDPKSGLQEDQIPPKEVVAMNASTVSIVFGIYAATLSPFLIFIFFRNFEILLVFKFNCLHDLSSLNPFSLIKVTAFSLLFLDNKFSPKFSLLPGKNKFL